MRNHPTFPRAVAGFVAAYIVVFGGMALSQGNREFIFYLVVMLLLIAMVYAVHRRVHFPNSVLWLLAVWGLLHLAGGTVPVPQVLAPGADAQPVLYSLRPWPNLPRYDQVTHAFGFFSATLASAVALRAATAPARIGIGFALACALMGVGFGALNEVVEFTAVMTLPNTNVGGYENTGWDLVSNAVGATMAAALIWLRRGAPAG
ncbi:MAG: DUF2238 domain-containing protein [Phycisphaerales bacterium]|nr:DUF2238 domain-containing protein [Phycisphaerales bacterium]